MPPAGPHRSSPLRRFALGGAALLVVLVVLLSCMGEPTAPKKSNIMYATGMRFNTVFPAAFQQSAFAGVVNFDRVRILIRRRDASVALDTTINFPATVDQITLALNVPLSPGASATGEDLMVSLGYLNTANDTVFKGTKQITATPSLPGQPAQTPVTIDVVYTGPGASATAVRISPRQVSVNGGGPFTFTAVAVDASGATIPNTPIAWSSLDVLRATITSQSAGSGVALNQRGAARIVASLITGQTDTAIVNVSLPPTAIALVSGSGQIGVIGKPSPQPFAQPLVVKVTSGDGLGASGVTVDFAAVTGGGSVSPTSAVTDADGLAQTTWTPGNTIGSQTATASAVGLTGSPVTFTATANQSVATTLVFTSAPVAGTSMNAQVPITLTVAAQDVDGDVVSTFTGTVTLSIGAGPSGSALAGVTSVAAVGGVATFANVSIATPGSGYVINAASTGLTSAATPAFNVVNGAATSITLVSGGGQAAAPGAVLAPITVALKDAAGNPTAGTAVSFVVASGGGTVSPVTAITDAAGQASATWTLGPNGGPQTLSVTSIGVSALTVAATASSTLDQVIITQQIGPSQTAGVVPTPGLIAEVRNSAGVLLSTYTGNVTLSIGNNPGSATLAGTTTVAAVNGIATFSAFSLNKIGVGYTVVVGSVGATSATSTAFDVLPNAPSVFTLVSGGAQSGQPNTALAAPIVVRLDDAFGNPVNGGAVQFSVNAGGGSVNPTSGTTNAAGTATTAWTLGAAGTQGLQIVAATLPNSPLFVGANFGAGGPATTTVSPQRDTITAFTDTRQLTAQGRDLAGNLVGGSWTWVSRTPSAATVNATGLVTAVVDGSSYIVATEAGGSKDSSLIVVQQRVATVNVNPLQRSIFNGGQFTFTAQAVDGRGVPMVTQPAFTWTSSVPSVATVNANGVATGVNLGSTQIRATAGNAVGVSNLTVLTPISRIDVSYDTTNAVAPDVFTLTALGDRRMYRAVARDTLLNVIPGISFTWSSSNASVALIDSTTSTQARAVAAANGITSIQASAQGVTGSATLNVAQVLSSIDLSPTSAIVGVTGTTQLLARGKDANGRFISGGAFVFTSLSPAVATVSASTGVVTGVANGTASITAASGQITSNVAVISVNNSGPPLISFGRDTIGIGRGTTASVPILLSKPNASAVVVNLAVADTFAFFTTASVTIPAGQTAVNAQLTGRNAGTTRVYAVDGGSTAYAGDTAVLAVQANLRMTTSSYGLNATDQIVTQALLSDPSPAGGTYVTFSYGTPGRALVSPDPAFIPAGQLAADVVIRGLSAGNTTLTPSASGVTGNVANVSVGAAVLSIPQSLIRVGEGQLDNANTNYVQVPQTLHAPLTVTLTSTDTTIATVVPTITLPANNSFNYFRTSGVGRGTARIIASAPGWVPDSVTMIVTTPMVRITGGQTLNTTNGPLSYTVYAADSTRNIHSRINSLAVRLSSSDTTVIKVIDSLISIPPGQQQANGLIIPGGSGGTAWLKSTASGHTPDSTQYIVNAPKLNLSYTSNRLGVGQQDLFNVFLPNTVSQPVIVTLVSSDSSLLATSQTVTVGAGGNNAQFTLRGKAVGAATLIASAVGYSPDTASTIVTTPKVRVGNSGIIAAFSTSSTSIRPTDSLNTIHPVTAALQVTVTSSDTTILTVDSVTTIAASNNSSPSIAVRGVSPGQAWIIASAPGHRPDSVSWTVIGAKLNFNFSTYFIGARQHQLAGAFSISTPQARTTAVPVTLTQKQPNTVALSATSLTIPANNSGTNFTLGGLATGRDTIIATAPGYSPDTAFVTVTSPKFSFLFQQSLPPTATTTSPPRQLNLYIADTVSNNTHYASDSVVVRAVSSDTTVVKPGQPFFVIPKDGYYAATTAIFTGPGTASITYSDSAGTGYIPVTTTSVTVTGPALSFNVTAGVLGMRQRTYASEYYVSIPNPIGVPVTVNLLSTDPRVATVPASVTIPANASAVTFRVTAQDTIGTIQVQGTATGYSPDNFTMQVTAPKFILNTNATQLNTTSPGQVMTLYAGDQTGNEHEVTSDVVVTLSSSSPGVASIDSNTVTIVSGTAYTQRASWLPHAVGTALLFASDTRPAFYRYVTDTAAVTVVTPTPFFSNSLVRLAPGQYQNVNLILPNIAASAYTVPIGHSAVPRTNTPSTVAVLQGQQSGNFRITGTSVGNDTLSATPPGHNTATMVAQIALGRLDPSSLPSSIAAGDSVLVTLFTRDAALGGHPVAAVTTITLTPSANIQFVSNGVGSAVITSISIPVDGTQARFWVKGVTAGAGTVGWSNPSYSPYTNSVTVTP
ncbi:MAG: Ig-like domain-containing protein [bacterium]